MPVIQIALINNAGMTAAAGRVVPVKRARHARIIDASKMAVSLTVQTNNAGMTAVVVCAVLAQRQRNVKTINVRTSLEVSILALI